MKDETPHVADLLDPSFHIDEKRGRRGETITPLPSNEALRKQTPVGSRWSHHKTGGPYFVIGHAKLQTSVGRRPLPGGGVADDPLDGALCVIYERPSTTIPEARGPFVRPASEFLDGRFVRLDDRGATHRDETRSP